MILGHITFESPIEFKDNIINVLVVENQKELSKYICEINSQIENVEEKFILSKEGNIVDFSKNTCMIIDPFKLNINDRNNIAKLYSKMKKESYDDNYVLMNVMISDMMLLLESISREQNFPIDYSDNIDIGNLFKLLDVKFNLSSESLLENICDYLIISKEYQEFELFVFVNLKSYLLLEELEQFYKFVMYNKINILLLENSIVYSSKLEKIKIIDIDLCEIDQSNEKIY